MVEYRETFLDKIKVIHLYFVEFNEDRSILPKDYYKNYTIGGLNNRLIIIITHNESIFLVNDEWQKI